MLCNRTVINDFKAGFVLGMTGRGNIDMSGGEKGGSRDEFRLFVITAVATRDQPLVVLLVGKEPRERTGEGKRGRINAPPASSRKEDE